MTMEKVVWSLEGHIFRQALLPIYLDMNITKYYPQPKQTAQRPLCYSYLKEPNVLFIIGIWQYLNIIKVKICLFKLN